MTTFDDIKNPLKLGSESISHRIIQGPLAGISCSAFRKVVSKYGHPALTFSEMLSAKSIVHLSQDRMHRYLHIDPDESKVMCQLSGQNAKDIGDAIQRVLGHGFFGFDINAGCPMPKIRKERCGSWWVEHLDELCCMLATVRQRFPDVLLGVKVRLSTQQNLSAWVKRIESTGVDYIIVHGRAWYQHYETPCRLEAIGEVVQQASIPIIGNGDVHDHQSLVAMLDQGVDAVMIARATIGHPELPKRLLRCQEGKPDQQISYQYFCEHLSALALLIPEKVAIAQSLRWLESYLGIKPIAEYTTLNCLDLFFDRLVDQLD
ncbi:MAG TPA: tRNA-dihydrouridine synthase family protein [Gammaproteobacteria bacterium]|nr:tRNA-dihydrouridine synthase family protein [Gammaproteobacteria bacterium]